MSAAQVLLMPQNGMRDAWSSDAYITPSNSLTNYDYSPPTTSTTGRRLVRPRSVPPKLPRENAASSSIHTQAGRPKTAIGYNRSECDRLQQVEYESIRKHNLDTHLPVKKQKPPPWQAKLDPPPVPCLVTPGYILARSKSKVAMYIKTDDFFEPQPEEEQTKPDPERDSLISQLQQQIDDLSLFLEEERINHKETKRKAADMLRDKIEEMTNQHANDIKMIVDQHREEMDSMRHGHAEDMTKHDEKMQAISHKLQGEIEFLQGAFDSYKTQLHIETTDKWKKREDDLRMKHEAHTQEKIHELRQKLIGEKNRENADIAKEHAKELHELRKLQRKEIDNLVKRFSNAAADIENLKQTEIKLQETQNAFGELQKDYENTCQDLTQVNRELTEAKIKLLSYEESFDLNVQKIRDKYKDQMDELMAQNADLKRLYVKKCGQLYEEKTEADNVRKEQVESAKETMKTIIHTRNKALVNLAAQDPFLDQLMRPPKQRPVSAPYTKQETTTAALSAGETELFVQGRGERARPHTSRPRILEAIAREQEGESGRNTSREEMEKILKGP